MKKRAIASLKLTLILSALFTFSMLKAQEKDMQKYLSDAKILVTEGKYQEALERYIWFHDHALEYNKAMSGVRLSFALSYWETLGKVYPPAMKALVDIRNKKTKLIEEGAGSVELFGDVTALNRTLREDAKTITLFENIIKTSPTLAKLAFIYAKDLLFKEKRYDIIKNYIGNPLREFAVVEEMYRKTSSLTTRSTNNTAYFKSFHDNSFVEHSIQLIEYALANDDVNSAKEIKKKAMVIVEDYRLRDLVIKDGSL